MKKIVSLISLFLAILLFSACGSNPTVKATPAPTAPSGSLPSKLEMLDRIDFSKIDYDYEPKFNDSYQYYDEWTYCDACEAQMRDIDAIPVRDGDYFICTYCLEYGDYRSCGCCHIVYHMDDLCESHGSRYCEECVDSNCFDY